jgi:CO/xanthine dehydrogenase Mo-binding subunit
MASGMELMLQQIFKALGIDPEEIKRNMFQTVNQLQTGIAALNTSLTEINARLERLETRLGVASKDAPEQLPPRRIAN